MMATKLFFAFDLRPVTVYDGFGDDYDDRELLQFCPTSRAGKKLLASYVSTELPKTINNGAEDSRTVYIGFRDDNGIYVAYEFESKTYTFDVVVTQGHGEDSLPLIFIKAESESKYTRDIPRVSTEDIVLIGD